MSNNLFLFTGQYPYSQYVECFLEDEIEFLAKAFEKVIIVPTRGASTKRSIPSNCIVTNPIFPSMPLFLMKGLYNRRTFHLLMKDFLENKVYCSFTKFGVWVKAVLVINNLLNSRVIQQIENSLDSSDVLYYYWGKWSNLLTLFIEKKCVHISRFHGAWDLWEEDFDNYAPLRKELSQKLDKAVFISRMGEKYFKKKYPVASTSFNPLGSLDYGVIKLKSDDQICFASCSTVYPLKRVDLIYRSIVLYAQNNSDKKVKWIHMGGGSSFNDLYALVGLNNPKNLTVNLLGNLSHMDVVNCYKNNHFDAFINLSTNEGVPVSIMEAISFNVPVVATAVGGTPEVVTEECGLLVSSNPSEVEVADALQTIINIGISPREFWKTHYSAEKNYNEFSDLLKELSIKN